MGSRKALIPEGSPYWAVIGALLAEDKAAWGDSEGQRGGEAAAKGFKRFCEGLNPTRH